MTPYTPKIVFDRAPDAQRVTYVDSDVFVLRSPHSIFEEFARSGKAVMITDHAYDAEYDHAAVVGQYCVQFMTFVRGRCEPVRQWWQDRCIEWCYATPQDGKLGDQKYLDDWPMRFGPLVHVLQQIDLLLAPWNARRFPYSRAVAWHFQGLRPPSRRRVLLHGPYSVPEIVHQMVYGPYLEELARSIGAPGRVRGAEKGHACAAPIPVGGRAQSEAGSAATAAASRRGANDAQSRCCSGMRRAPRGFV